MKLFEKVLLTAVVVLTCASLLSFAAFATGEDGGLGDTASFVESAPSDETSSVESEAEEVSSDIGNTEEVTSEESTPSEGGESQPSGEQETTSSETTEGNTGGTQNTNSNTEENTGETEEPETNTEETESEVRIEPDVPYQGTVSEDWSGDDVTVNISSKTEETKKDSNVRKDIFDFRSLAVKAMIITSLVALICVCALVFINVKYRQSKKAEGEEPKKKLKATKRASRKPRA